MPSTEDQAVIAALHARIRRVEGDAIDTRRRQDEIARAERLGATAFELLAARMAGRRARRRVVLPAELLVRGSTGRSPAGRRPG